MILQQILRDVEVAVGQRRARCSQALMERRASASAPPRGFVRALDAAPGGLGLIAELKKASPSKGIIRQEFDVRELASGLAAGGADCLSVLTEEKYFKGSLANLEMAESTGLPRLQKDFVVSEYQVFEGRAAGADAILLIAEALQRPAAKKLCSLILDLGMDVLFESHNSENIEWVAEIASLHKDRILVGINNRNLETFEVRLRVTFDWLDKLPTDLRVVSESGISTSEDVQALKSAGATAILVGETLMRANDVASATRDLMSTVRS